MGSTCQFKNVLRNGSALCSDGFRLSAISIVYFELVSVIKEPLCDATSHVAQANESEFHLICSKTSHGRSFVNKCWNLCWSRDY
jgi:hypothetical protein